MIKLPLRPPVPAALQSDNVSKARKALKSKVARRSALSAADFKGKSYWGKGKKILQEYQSGKCCFCERRRDANGEADVEHFRPKLEIMESPAHSGYWWLAYEWDNHLFCCKACNSHHKKNHFPLVDESARAFTPKDDLLAEQPVLINPSTENPADFIDYDWESDPTKVFPIGKDPERRGAGTIEMLALAIRDDLIKARFEVLTTLQLAEEVLRSGSEHDEMYRKALQKLRHKVSRDQEHAGFANCYVRRKGLEGYLDG